MSLLAPLIANDVPIVARVDSRWRLPVLDGRVIAESARVGFRIDPPIPHSPDRVSLTERLQGPNQKHWLGTDELGRDILARLIYGGRISLSVGLLASLISLVIGVTLGAVAGYFGGALDWVVSRVIEVVLCFPFLFLVLAIVALVGPSVWTIIIALGISSWTTEARFVRGEMMRLRSQEFAQAATAVGAGNARIIFAHLLPNAIAPAIVSAGFGAASAIIVESALSFLGFGVPLPKASWGSILSSASEYLGQAWWIAMFPGIAIFLTVVSLHTIAERLRDSLDPASSNGFQL